MLPLKIQTCGSPALRVVQLDSHILDKEIQSFLEKQLDEIFSNLPISCSIFYQNYIEEVRLMINSVLWIYRLMKGYSPGQNMMNIAYRIYPRKIIILHFFLSSLLPYLAQKLIEQTTNLERKTKLQRFVNFFKVLDFVHHLNFLRIGGYSSIFERILKLKTEYITPPTLGLISFTTLNRELLWHSYKDLLLLALPLVQTTRQLWNRWKTRQLLRKKHVSLLKPVMKPFYPLICNRCEKIAIIPVQNQDAKIEDECGHIFCLYCYDPTFECPKCGNWLIKGKETMLRGIINPFAR